MIILLAVILGLVQALTEFLPISSSAHLILARAALDFQFVDGLTFDVALHVGTLAAVLVYFYRDILMLIRGLFANFTPSAENASERRLVWMVIAACIPAGIVGFFFEEAIEVYFRHPGVIVVTLVLGGLLFLLVERVCKCTKTMEDMTLGRAVLIGLAQTLALIPGVSRSGITIATGMLGGFRREESARFSFVMVSPLLAGAGLKKALDLRGTPLVDGEMTVLIVGVVVSALAGWAVIKFLLGFLRKHGLGLFAWYRFVLAAVVAVYLLLA